MRGFCQADLCDNQRCSSTPRPRRGSPTSSSSQNNRLDIFPVRVIAMNMISDQSVTFWCRYWSRDRSRDHFGLENGLETSLVTLGSVTFWSQNGLETGSRPFWSRKWSRDLVSSLSVVEVGDLQFHENFPSVIWHTNRLNPNVRLA